MLDPYLMTSYNPVRLCPYFSAYCAYFRVQSNSTSPMIHMYFIDVFILAVSVDFGHGACHHVRCDLFTQHAGVST